MAIYLNGSDLMLIGESLTSLKCRPPIAPQPFEIK